MYRLILLVVFSTIVFTGQCWSAEGIIKGRLIAFDGKPLSNGQVFFFNTISELQKPVIGKYWRVPDAVERLDAKGGFAIQLEEGVYYLGAIKRLNPKTLGPPQEGDLFLPIHDKRGKYRKIKVKADVVTDLGTLGGIRRYSTKVKAYKGKVTAIEGQITTDDGSPVEGLSVFAYLDPSMTGHPQFVSEPSNINGQYRLLVDTSRTFYLKVRSGYAGGTPQAGALLGVYGGADNPAMVTTKEGTFVRKIDIVVMPFSGSGKPGG